MEIVCPHCSQPVQFPNDLSSAGASIRCPYCQEVFQLPGSGTPVPPPWHDPRQTSPTSPRYSQPHTTSPVGWILLGGVVSIAVAVGVWWYSQQSYRSRVNQMTQDIRERAKEEMGRIHQQVASDAIAQYQITKRNGTAMDAFVQAGVVAAAFLQAKDEANYQKWKAIERQEAARAGIP